MKKRFIFVLLVLSILPSILLCGCSDSAKKGTATEVNKESVSNSEAFEESSAETSISSDSELDVELAELVAMEKNDEKNDLTSTQRNSLNMLNYLVVLTQQINDSKDSRAFLESTQSSLLNNINPNAVDSDTLRQINTLWEIIDDYRMVSVKRKRLEYMYEQNQALALREAIPNPLGLLSAIKSKNTLEAVASVLYMAVDSISSYEHASTQADLKYLQDGWILDDEETKVLSESQRSILDYTVNVVNSKGIPGKSTLTQETVTNFVEWSNEDNLVRKIRWLEDNEKTYSEFFTYWLELAKSYYNAGEYKNCLIAIERYQKVASPIFRKDYDFLEALPIAIISARKIMPEAEYVKYANKYLEPLADKEDTSNWVLRYFAAQSFIELYDITKDKDYLEKAYQIIRTNVNELVGEQKTLNEAYLNPVKKEPVPKDATKREKQEIDEYNNLIIQKRKTELPPVSEAFYLNCELLFALADELNVFDDEKIDIDKTIHENDNGIFLNRAIDNRFWASKNVPEIDSNDIDVEFDGEKLVIPAGYVTDNSVITATTSNGTILKDWTVAEVNRPKDSTDFAEFTATLTSKEGKQYKYSESETITITVVPISDAQDETLEFNFKVVAKKKLFVFNGVEFERILK